MNRLIVVMLALIVTFPAFIKSRLSTFGAARTAFSLLPPPAITVRIDGAVRHPGVYSFSANIMTDSAIDLAEPVWSPVRGGSPGCASPPLINGSSIHVSRNRDDSVAKTVGSMTAPERIILGLPLDMNSMGVADFDRLPGIGPVLAARIVEYRQINGGKLRPEDLLSVKGIGQKKYNVLKKYFN